MPDFNIRIPKGCACSGVEIGEYGNQVELKTPDHMIALVSIGALSFRETTCVDRCIADSVQALWAMGVVTTGCCCGHNQGDGYIGLWETDAQQHLQPGRPMSQVTVSRELLCCPFCGGEPLHNEQISDAWVECGSCGASGPAVRNNTLDARDRAAVVWNTRAKPQAATLTDRFRELSTIIPAGNPRTEDVLWNALMSCRSFLLSDGASTDKETALKDIAEAVEFRRAAPSKAGEGKP